MHLRVLSGSQKKQQLFLFTALTYRFLIISLYSINLSVFITEAESIYCAVRTGSLNHTDTVASL